VSVFIIAEAGVNHNGSIQLAKEMIDIVSESGANAIKFQTFKAKNLVLESLGKADYQKQNTNSSESQYEMLKKLELSYYDHSELIVYCNKKNIEFLSSPFDLESIDLLSNLKMRIFKIPSGEITNLPYLRKVGQLQKKVILSTGMSNLIEIKNALSVLIDAGTLKTDITVLHANTMYPTPMRDVNLNAMLSIREEFNVDIGYSDHTLGIEVDIAAVALGATCIEKHFTLNKSMKGPDHKMSLSADEFCSMVKSIRNIEEALGNGIKIASPSEIKNIEFVRKSIVAIKNIAIGEMFSEQNISTKRPGLGISPMKWDDLIGSISTKSYKKDDLI
jgi:N,N'-diacetyllegionaminate synthase